MKKTTILIIILFVFTVGLIYIAVQTEKNSPPVIPSEEITEQEAQDIIPTINPQSVLSFEPVTLDTTQNIQSTYSATIVLDTNGQEISGAQIELSYDPAILRNVSIFPAENNILGTNPSVILNKVDQELGRISLEILIAGLDSEEISGNGNIATLNFSLNSITAQSTEISFINKTTIRSIKSTNSLLQSASPLTILLNEATPIQNTPTAGPLPL